jgi:hypothetical protein
MRPGARHAAIAIGCLCAADACAQTMTLVGVPPQGHGAVALTSQFVEIRERTVPRLFGGGVHEFGQIVRRTLLLEIDYGLTDRLALNLALPYRSNRYRGDFPHDPRLLLDDHGQRFLDDGEYHSTLGDFGASLRWQWLLDPVAVTPFVGAYVPTHDYPLFTETQAGTRQWQVDVGVNAGGRFGRSNFYWQGGYAYSYLQETRPRGFRARRVNHGTSSAEFGWIASPSLTLRVNLSHRDTYGGLVFPDEFSAPPDTERDDLYYYHDQLFQWESTTASLGAQWRAGDAWVFSFDYGRTVGLEWGHKIRHAITAGASRSF